MNNASQKTGQLFFGNTGIDEKWSENFVSDTLTGMDDGELFMEYRQSESLSYDDGRVKTASFNTMQGFGLRAVMGETIGYAHSSAINKDALKRSAETVRSIKSGYDIEHNLAANEPAIATAELYSNVNPIDEIAFADKIKLLEQIDHYVRRKDNRVRQLSASIYNEWQAVRIIRSGGFHAADIRPLVRLSISVVLEQDGRMERGSSGAGGRFAFSRYLNSEEWQKHADEALRQAGVNMEAIAAPAGEMTVVLGNGWPGVLLHEAVGHGLEGDFNRKKTSAFSEMMGKRVASPGVTVVDDGTIADRRGSINIDDEGTPSGRTVLIEDGILRGYMQDRLNARLMGVAPTGNGRRESYSSQPLPRMTNTFMLGGDASRDDIISSVKRGLYAPQFGGGQVDITSGKFVFSATEAYLIDNGRITSPVKGATLIGNGPDVLTRIRAIGNDMELDLGVGTCGKAGQSVPVGVGQPTLLIEGLTVGGTA